MKTKIITLTLLLGGVILGYSQGFVNLNFENAKFVSDPTSGYYPYAVYASNAIPGWTAYVSGNPTSLIFSNDISLSGGDVDIIGTNWVYPQIQGNYFVRIAGVNYPGQFNTSSIGQTGQIPIGALSFTFWGLLNGGAITFNGQPLFTDQIGSTANYNIYAVDVSAYTGLTGELLFTSALAGETLIDNIQFSTAAVPEPSTLALTALGSLLLGFRRWEK